MRPEIAARFRIGSVLERMSANVKTRRILTPPYSTSFSYYGMRRLVTQELRFTARVGNHAATNSAFFFAASSAPLVFFFAICYRRSEW